MFNFDKIDLTLSYNTFIFITVLLLLIFYSYYTYRHTIPLISKSKKIFLVALRSLAIFLILLIIFEPKLLLTKKFNTEPVNLVFVDNSRSMQIKDGTERVKTERSFLNRLLESEASSKIKLYTFGNKINELKMDSLSTLSFSESGTNFSNIFNGIKNLDKDIASLTIISDGVITDGTNPAFSASKLNIPVFTIGVGDSTKRNDVTVKNVLYNEFIYAQTETPVIATISNTGFGSRQVNISLFENDIRIDQKNIILNNDGIQNIILSYKPGSEGEKKLAVIVSGLPGEFTTANNRKVFYVDVLSNKLEILLLAGSPTPDLSFIKNALRSDENLDVNSITQISQNRFVENNNREKLIDSSDVIFLIGFPTKETTQQLLAKVVEAIRNDSKPVFVTLSAGTDFSRLKVLQSDLPFTFQLVSNNGYDVQPVIQPGEINNALLQNNSQNLAQAWNNLPPVNQPDALLTAKPESNVLAKVTINNVPVNRPLILTRKLGSKRSVAVLAKNIWRWKLQTALKNSNLFDRFILNSVKWLSSKEDRKQVTIKTSKKIFSPGEPVEFTGQIYDESFNPASDAEVNVRINNGAESFNVTMNSIGNGLYEGNFEAGKSGDFKFTGEALQDGKLIGKDSGNFNIGEVDVELLNPVMNYELLRSLASITEGEYFPYTEYEELFPTLNRLSKRAVKEETETTEINLWSNTWLLTIVIILLGFEWFFRKRFGML